MDRNLFGYFIKAEYFEEAEKRGVNVSAISGRLSRGWTLNDAINTPNCKKSDLFYGGQDEIKVEEMEGKILIKGKYLTDEQERLMKENNLDVNNVRTRLNMGWSFNDAVGTPKGEARKPTKIVKKPKVKKRKPLIPVHKRKLYKDGPEEIKDMIGRIKYMQSTDMLNPPVITGRMKARAKEYNINIDKVKMVEVDLEGVTMKAEYEKSELDESDEVI